MSYLRARLSCLYVFIYSSSKNLLKMSTPTFQRTLRSQSLNSNTLSRTNSSEKNITHSFMNAALQSIKQEIISTISAEIKTVSEKLSNLEERINKFESVALKISVEQETQAHEIENLKEDVKNVKLTVTEDVIYEAEQRFKRRQNIIIAGLPEPSSGSLPDRKKVDEEEVRQLFCAMNLPDINFKQSVRFGKVQKGKIRPIRVNLVEEDSKFELLRRARSLRTTDRYKSVYINPDRTSLEQSRFISLQREVQGRRSRGEDVVLFRGKVVSRNELALKQNFRR